ncbi:MAG: hypothetical protein JWN76_1754 [Chitinophagaceae bacterium]|nr:hypothetical protein [Chitinophagaceae bacterium]
MDNLSEIKNIWLSANLTSLPQTGEMMKTIKRYRLKLVLKKTGMILLTLILAAVMIWVVCVYHSQLLVTRIGEACIFIALVILLIINTGTLVRVSAIKNCTNSEFLEYLKAARRRQTIFQQRTQVLGLSFASAGLCLYLFEAVRKDIQLAILTYTLAISWLALNWFVFRPRVNRKKAKELNERIEKIQNLSNQLSNN